MFKLFLAIALFLCLFVRGFAAQNNCTTALAHSQSLCNHIKDFEIHSSCIKRNMIGFDYTYPDEYFLNYDDKFACADVSTLHFQAWLRATFPDQSTRNGELAVKMALTAIQIKDGPSYRDTLAAALAESGRFEDAVREQQRAISMLKQDGIWEDIQDYELRLRLYSQGKPYRQTR